MNHKQRFKDALSLKELNSLPHGEQMIHDQLVAKISHSPLSGDNGNALWKWMCERMSPENYARHKKARVFLGFDWVQVFPVEPPKDMKTLPNGQREFNDIWGGVQILSDQSSRTIKKPINTENDLLTYEFPKIEDFDFYNIQLWVRDGEFSVAAQLDTGFFKISQLTGFEEYMIYASFHKEKLHELMRKFVEFEKRMIDKLVSLGIDVLWLSNDHCYNSGPFLSPETLKELDFDYMEPIVRYAHEKGLLVNFHCCGNVEKTLKYIVDTGIDALHSMQPSAGNDIYKYKKEYGKYICLIGNLDIDYLLPQGSPCDIEKKVREMYKNLFYDNKGWVLSTTNMLNNDIPIENAIALHLIAEYGRF